MKAVLYMVIPCYNEEEVLPVTSGLFLEELQLLIEKEKISEESRILFVNDGSKDRTWEIIEGLARENPHFIGICQSRNRGHQNAVLAGLMEAKDVSDITISIDCDGQDDIATMEAMVITKITAPPIPAAVLTFFDTPKNGQIPMNWLRITLFTRAADIANKIIFISYSSFPLPAHMAFAQLAQSASLHVSAFPPVFFAFLI